jgi:hypothetical protein
MDTLKKALLTKKAKIAAGGGLLAVSGMSSAVDTAAAITSAFSAANTNVGMVIAGVITLVAVATGVGLIIKFLSH